MNAKKDNPERGKMSRKYFVKDTVAFHSDESPSAAGDVISLRSRSSDDANAFMVLAVSQRTDLDKNGNRVGGTYYAAYSNGMSRYDSDRSLRIFLATNDTVVTTYKLVPTQLDPSTLVSIEVDDQTTNDDMDEDDD